MTDTMDYTGVVRLDECPPGLFSFEGTLCFKSEYATTAQSNPCQPDAYVVDSGEYFWGGTGGDSLARSALMVEPIDPAAITDLTARLASRRAAPSDDDVAKVVERLGCHHEHPVTGKMVLINPDGPEAADLIVSLQSRLAEAGAEVEHTRAMYENLEASEVLNGYKLRAEAAEAALATVRQDTIRLADVAEAYTHLTNPMLLPAGAEQQREALVGQIERARHALNGGKNG